MTAFSLHPKYPLLFSPLPLGAVTLKNRIVMPPMATAMGVDTERACAFYGTRAKGGVGMIILEGTLVDNFRAPDFCAAVARLAEAIHANGAAAVMQLYKGSQFNGEDVAVSAIDNIRAITTDEAASIPMAFGEAAAACEQAGFDGVEVHGAHGFFFNQFFSPRFNRREDRYGGNLLKRMCLGIETVAAIRQAVKPAFLVMYRHTAAEYVEDGYDLQETLAFIPELEKSGLNVIDISPSTAPEPAPHAGLAASVKAVAKIPVIAVGGMNDPAVAEATLREGKANLVAIGRGLIADPEWPNKVRDGREAEITCCIGDNEKCFGNLGKGVPISCTQNPRAGFEFHEE
jgi:2,4-dienoyl-CoA reductase-like NADH-dependent reductase (Old Yellow Enzyme family)